jgi:cytochrome c oxidase subunit 2
MLLRVYIDSRQQFDKWVQDEKMPAVANASAEGGRRIFETTACVNCHAVAGTIDDGRSVQILPI